MSRTLKMKVIQQDERGRTYSFQEGRALRIRAFWNGDDVTTFRIFRGNKEITPRDIDMERMGLKKEKLIAEALYHVFRNLKDCNE